MNSNNKDRKGFNKDQTRRMKEGQAEAQYQEAQKCELE